MPLVIIMFIHNKKFGPLIKKMSYSIISIVLIGGAQVAEAALNPPTRARNLADFIKEIANIAMQIGGIVAVIFIIWSGFLFVTARGNEEQIKKARATFFWTIIGAFILLGAYAVALAVVSFVTSL